MTAFVLRTDGGARGNPGPAGAGWVLENPDGGVVASGGRYIGVTTNNVAEYEALLLGLECALERGVKDLRVFSDSELVVRQLTGRYRVKHENMKPLHARAMTLIGNFGSCFIQHVERAQNAAADALVNEAIDTRANVGDATCSAEGGTGRRTALFEDV